MYVSPKTRDVECAKTFVEKHGKVDSFIEDGSCSIVESKGRGGDFKRFSDCMIAPFEKVKKAEAEKNLCDGLKEISECETVHTACKNEYIGLAHGIANVSNFSKSMTIKANMSILYSSLALLEITKEQNVSKSSLPKIPKLCPLEHLKLKKLRNLRTLKPLKALDHLRALRTLLNHQEFQNHFGWRLKSLMRNF